jgi:hypothetical protein
MPQSESQLSEPDFASQLNIESLIAAPLIAASKANVMMITGQTRALLENCFKRTDNGNYEPVTINMVLMRGSVEENKSVGGTPPAESHRVITTQLAFSVPLICLIPINNIVVDKIKVDFDLEITSVYHSPGRGLAGGDPINDRKAALHGRIANRKSDGTVDEKGTARLKVNINASPLPLPLGLLSVLDLYSKSIQPIPTNNQPQP